MRHDLAQPFSLCFAFAADFVMEFALWSHFLLVGVQTQRLVAVTSSSKINADVTRASAVKLGRLKITSFVLFGASIIMPIIETSASESHYPFLAYCRPLRPTWLLQVIFIFRGAVAVWIFLSLFYAARRVLKLFLVRPLASFVSSLAALYYAAIACCDAFTPVLASAVGKTRNNRTVVPPEAFANIIS